MGTILNPNRGHQGKKYWNGKRWCFSKALALEVSDEELDRRALLSMPVSRKTPYIPRWPSTLGEERDESDVLGVLSGASRHRGYTAQD
jgi:hypothetical protein